MVSNPLWKAFVPTDVYSLSSVIAPSMFPHLSVIFLILGVLSTAYFFLYELTVTKENREIKRELLIGVSASISLAIGVLFLMLWVGLFV